MSLRKISILTLVLLPLVLPLSLLAADSTGSVLITGANRGIGLALAEKFKAAGFDVIGTARSPQKADDLKALDVRVEQLDVTDPASVSALAQRLDGLPLDYVINNAGIKGHDSGDLAELDIEKLDMTLDVNTLGPLRVIQALVPNVRASKHKVFANISSMMGSMEMNTWGCCLGYRASKSALNSFTKTLAVDYADTGLVFVTMHPGYVQTDMNDGQGNITTAQSAEGLFNVISELTVDDNGKYYDWKGKELPW